MVKSEKILNMLYKQIVNDTFSNVDQYVWICISGVVGHFISPGVARIMGNGYIVNTHDFVPGDNRE